VLSTTLADVTTETVVLLNDRGEAIGTRDKAEVHTEATPLHLAFSLYVFDQADRVLLTRRALDKKTWPGVWTNTCCGHPGPGEDMASAVRRRLSQELGVQVGGLTCLLPHFAYTAIDASGIVENEMCPVFAGRLHPDAHLSPNRGEVMDWAWTPWAQLVAAVSATPFVFSPWAVAQVREIPGHPLP
jgi:isopentenyl-diphosphate Delta-isomerase